MDTGSDSWGQLLSEFGIESQAQDESTPPESLPPSTDFATKDADASSQPKEKKQARSRFPKVNFFGTPPEVSLDSVIESVKSPSLGGKTFTDNKLEKMPVSQEWTDRQEKNVTVPDAFSAVASQIDALASGGSELKNSEGRPAKRQISSMFDDPVPESVEERALKNIMGEPVRREETRKETYSDAESDTWQRSRGRQRPQSEEREGRGRGSRYKPPVEVDDLPESDFQPIDDEPVRPQGRGRRGSRYAENTYRERDREPIRDDGPQEEWSEVDVALQQTGRGEPVQRGERERGGRRPRYDKRREPEQTERPAFDRESSDLDDSGIVAVHGSIPSWDDAIGDIITANISRHKSQSGSGRGRR